MKKILPVIITLVGLSLLGLIILQASWLNNLLQLREQQISFKISKAHYAVTSDLGKQLYNKTPRQLQGLRLRDDMFNILKPKLVSQQFSVDEIKEKFVDAFINEDLKNIKFEFAVINNTNESELYTKQFAKTLIDTTNCKRFVAPISESGTAMEGFLSERVELLIPDFKNQIWGSLIWVLIGSGLFTIIIFAAFYITVKTLLKQKKISEIKSDFINNMTHEFKTPLATISLAVDAIRNEKVQTDISKLLYFSGIIKEENIRMNRHVETILQAALLERKELQFNNKKVNANILVASVVDNYNLQLKEKKAVCKLQLNAQNDLIEVDELHFTNVVSNLVDNAIKYSKENLEIKITSNNNNNNYTFEVEDNGIGMNKETIKNVFEKFYRAHTGNVHNVKGFGLGMSYVKTIIDAINGTIKVNSTLGKGTIFTVEVPLV